MLGLDCVLFLALVDSVQCNILIGTHGGVSWGCIYKVSYWVLVKCTLKLSGETLLSNLFRKEEDENINLIISSVLKDEQSSG